jgi:hypothetical protein
MKTISELLDYCKKNNLQYISVDELEQIEYENKYTDGTDELTQRALDLLCDAMATHRLVHNELEQKLIETGVLSGKCYVCWHENQYYPGATVDNLRKMGFEAFYETYKRNWEEVKRFRRELIARKELGR